MNNADTAPTALPAILQTLRTAWQANRPSLEQRRSDLQRLRAALKARLPQMAEAIAADFGHRSTHESLIADGMTVLNEIDHLLGQAGWVWAGGSGRRGRRPAQFRSAWSG